MGCCGGRETVTNSGNRRYNRSLYILEATKGWIGSDDGALL